jgi:YYY domain-containing protein
MIAKLSSASTAVAFNLGLASTAALAATAAFGLAYELVRLGRATLRAGIAAGFIAALFLVVLGNLEGVIEFAIANGYASDGLIARVNIHDLEIARESDACLPPLFGQCFEYPSEESSFWWWWRATRISPDGNSITEFPFFSFLLGDLHPHVMAIPFVLTVYGLGIAFWRSNERLELRTWSSRPALLLVSGVLVGGLGFLNTWDLPAFLFLLGLLVLARNLIEPWSQVLPTAERLARAVAASVGFVLPLAILAFMLYVPFYLSFSSQAGGIDAVQTAGTLPLHSTLFWAPLVAMALPLPLVLLNRDSLTPGRAAIVILLPLLLLVAWAAHIAFYDGASALGDAISDRGSSWLTTLFFSSALGATLLALWRTLSADDDTNDATIPALIATATAFVLILGAELFYVQDVFNSRLNTVFKLSYQAWILLAISGAFSLYWLVREWQPEPGTAGEFLRGAWGGLAALVLAGAMLYPLGATLSRTEGLDRANRTLDGLAFARTNTEDFSALGWLRSRAGRDEVIIEATGGQYSGSARIAAWTGIPTVIGWAGHEVQWGRDNSLLMERQQDVDRAYTTESLVEALSILRKYGVTYVFVGSLERSKYPPAGLQKFASGMQAVIETGQSAVYRVPIAGELAGPAD